MPESEKRKENSSEAPKGTEFDRFKALASSLLKVPKAEVDAKKSGAQPPKIMKPLITLWLTKHPVYDMSNFSRSELRFTAWILEDLKITETLTADVTTPLDVFSKNAISWASQQLKASGRSIDLVAGDAANQAIIEKAGLKYSADPNLRSLPIRGFITSTDCGACVPCQITLTNRADSRGFHATLPGRLVSAC